MGGTCSTREGEERGISVLVGKTEGSRPFGRPGRRWNDSIKMDLKEVRWRPWTRLMWLRIRAGRRGVSCKCRFRKIRRLSGLAEDTLASHEGLRSLQPVTCLVVYITKKGIQSCAQLKFSRPITVAFPI